MKTRQSRSYSNIYMLHRLNTVWMHQKHIDLGMHMWNQLYIYIESIVKKIYTWLGITGCIDRIMIQVELIEYIWYQLNAGWIELKNRSGQTRTGWLDPVQAESIKYSLNETKAGIITHTLVTLINYKCNQTKTWWTDHIQTKLIKYRQNKSNTS